MRHYFLSGFIAVILMVTSGGVSGQILTEDFNYTAGTTLVSNGYTASSGSGTNNLIVNSSGLSYPGSPSSGIGLDVAMTTSGEDVGKTFAAITSGNVYNSFLVKASAAQTTGDYFTGLSTGTAASPAFILRIYIKATTGGYFFGISKGSGTITYETTVRSFGTVYLVVGKYTFNTGTTSDDVVNLYVNPSLGGTEPSSTISISAGSDAASAGITGYFLRQGSSSNASTQEIDAIRVGTTWASVTPQADPTTTSISPSSANDGDPGFTITVNGTNFIDGSSTVTWNGSSRTTTFVSATQLTAVIPASDISTAGSATVGVTTTGAANPSNTQTFTINTPPAGTPTKLTITSVSPSSPVAGSAFSVTVQAQDGSGSPANVTSATGVTLSLHTGTGTLGGTLTGTIASGSNAVIISGVTYMPAETGVKLTATPTAGMTGLTPATSTAFNVVEAAPTTTSSAIIFGTQTTTTISITSFTPGNGANRIIVARLSSVAAVAPATGTSYTANSTSFTDGVNNTTGTGSVVVYNGNGSGPLIITDLSPGTQYSFDIYEYNGTGGTSNYGSAFSAARYTLQTEPTAHSAAFTVSSIQPTSLTLNFDATTSTTGYIILQKAGSSASSGTPVDGTNYTTGSTLGDGTIAAMITAAGTSSVPVTGLTPGSQYTFSLIPFGRTGTTAESYNYYTGGTIPTVTATTLNDYVDITAVMTSFNEDFNSLANTGAGSSTPAGWMFAETGTNANNLYTAGTGSSSAGDTYSFGSASAPSDRAFGGVQSSPLIPTIGAKFKNSTGTTITFLRITYIGEQWRLGATGRNDKLDFQYSTNATGLLSGTWTDVDALDFIAPKSTGTTGALDGNAAANRTTISFSISGLSITAGSTFFIRWNDFNATSSDDGLAIDNFSIEANPSDPNPPVITSTTPANGATNVAANPAVTIVFNESIQKGTGNILVKKSSDGSTVQTIDVTSSTVTVSGTTTSFNISGLLANTSYYINIDAGAVKDFAGNGFAGIPDNTTWQFTTGSLLYEYNFNNCTTTLPDGFTQYSVTGPQVWGCTTFGRDPNNLPSGSAPYGVQMNGFAGGSNVTNEDWLISPSFNLTATTFPLLSFWSRTAFEGSPLQLKISTDYTGTGDPNAATWTDLNGKFPAQVSDKWTLSSNINLSGYKQPNVYIAFVYRSTTEDGARWTLDDISIDNSATPPPPTLTVSASDIQFNFVASGSTADKTFTFTGNDLTGGVTLNSTGAFTLSKDGTAFTPSLTYSQAEADNITKTVFVRFAPTTANQNFTGTVVISTPGIPDTTISLKGTSIDPVKTLEVVNWNIEWFGSTSLGPTDDNQQEQNVKTIMQNIGADIYALTEVVSEARLQSVVNSMPGYSYVISNYGSHTNTSTNPPSALADAQKLAFVYKTNMFSNISTIALLSQGINSSADISNPAYNYFASGRFPFMMSADVTLNGFTKNVKFVLLHAKANTAPTATSYERRKKGADTLHHTFDVNYPNDHIILLGDFNDDLDQTITTGINPPTTSYSTFMNHGEHFTAPTLALSLAGKKSTVSYNDVIDHVIISNEMNQYYMSATAGILTDVTSLVSRYGSTTSDHYPVFSRYSFSNSNTPVITSNGGDITADTSIAENRTAVTTVKATDADAGAMLTYSLTGGADAGKFNINSTTGELTFMIAPNFESPTDAGANNTYEVIVRVSDEGDLTDEQALTVTIANVNEAPVITSDGGGATATKSIQENRTTVTTVTATDPDAGTTLTYSINGGTDAGKFSINTSTGSLRFITAPNFEAPTDADGNNRYIVTVSVSDGSLSDDQTITVTVINTVDNAPVITTPGNGNNMNTKTPTYAGKAEALSEINIIVDGISVGFTNADGSENWTYTQPAPLQDGSHTLRVTSSAGGDTLSSNTVSFTVTSSSGVLPVTIVNVRAYQKTVGIQVDWTTLTEINTDRFEVERSSDRQTFTAIGSVAGRGNSSSRQNYQLLDPAALTGANYYRIKSIDKNGEVQYSNVVRVNIGKGTGVITVYPNPVVNNTINLQFTNVEKGKYTITLTNKLGQQLYRSVIEHNGGSSIQTLRINGSLQEGTYQLLVLGKEMTIVQQLIKN